MMKVILTDGARCLCFHRFLVPNPTGRRPFLIRLQGPRDSFKHLLKLFHDLFQTSSRTLEIFSTLAGMSSCFYTEQHSDGRPSVCVCVCEDRDLTACRQKCYYEDIVGLKKCWLVLGVILSTGLSFKQRNLNVVLEQKKSKSRGVFKFLSRRDLSHLTY